MNEQVYLNALKEVFEKGTIRKTRNATTISYWSIKMDFDLQKGFPLLTTKKMYWKGILEELLWFIRGDTNAKHLIDKKVHIWDGNSSRDFLDKIGLTNYKENDCGPIYGFQWRHFNAPYKGCDEDYSNQGIDQLQQIIDTIKSDPTSRRMFMSGWNPCQIKEMCLPPCHVSYQFYVEQDELTHQKILSCMMYQRSGDMFLGVPFNIASTSLLVHLIASLTDCIPGKVNIVVGDAHIYDCHIEAVKEQLIREPLEPPTLKIDIPTDSTESFTINDFESTQIKLLSYKSHPKIEAPMIA